MLYKTLDTITLDDLQGMCDRKVREGAQLDFKDALPGANDDGKKEFLRDITALANTAGGDLVYGLREERDGGEKTGIAGEVVGIEGLRFDEKRLWMESLIRDNTEPRLLGVDFHPVQVDENRSALIVRVPRSWNGPHVVSFGKHWRFYARNSAGNYPMDVAQLRDTFLAGSSLQDKLEGFRTHRLDVLKNELSSGGPFMVLHLQPFESAQPSFAVNLRAARWREDDVMLAQWIEGKSPMRHNFDGILARDDKNNPNYLQIYRSGVTEEVDTSIFIPNMKDGGILINAVELDRHLFRAIGRRLALLKSMGITSPVMIQLALLNVQGLKLLTRSGGTDGYFNDILLPYQIDRPNLVLRGITIENIQELPLEGTSRIAGTLRIYPSWDLAQPIARDLLDIIWNAAGAAQCEHYDIEGKWLGHLPY